MKMKKGALLVAGMALCLLCGCGQKQAAEVPQEAKPETAAAEQKVTAYADIAIRDYGTVTVALCGEAAPETVENFITLAKDGFYDGLTFHRIMEGFMMQGGDPNGNGTGGSDKTSALLSRSEQVPTEHYTEGDMIRVYVVEVRRSNRGPQVIVSRTHPGLVKRLFELEVPEIASGAVEVKSIAREAGSRTKIAVHAAEANVDPVGACVGPRGGRVGAVVDELHGEKMDIVVWSEDPCQFVASALSPATVLSVSLLPGAGKACRVVVPDDQLSLAIGKEGQNARLAARLTGYKIDIRPASQADADEPEAPAELPAEPEEA